MTDQSAPGPVVRSEEWRNHQPYAHSDMSGYDYLSCSCGWDTSDPETVMSWEEHIDAAAAPDPSR